MKPRYRIFDYTWHVPHQYDLACALADQCEFDFCVNLKKQWDTSSRPVPKNASFVSHYIPHSYDIALLHVDQQTIVDGHLKRTTYDQFNHLITDIPKLVINHGTPVFPERFLELGQGHLTTREMETRCVEMMKTIVGDNTMIVNSHTAASEREWGFGIPVIHGMNPDEWYDRPKEPRVFTALAPAGFDTYYNRQCAFEVSRILFEKYNYVLYYAQLNVQTNASADDYKNFLGESLLYLDVSFRTPMNRARTEAFLSGCCVIQVEGGHDLDRWAVPGHNIVLVPNDAVKIADTIADLIENNYQRAIAIGQAGKAMSREMFSPARYAEDWLTIIANFTNK